MENDILSFSCQVADGESTSVTFTMPEDYTIYTLHRLCKRFAAALGYAESTIEKAFGETVWED